jgi:hypothetical protein
MEGLLTRAGKREEDEPMRLIKERRTTPHDLGEYRAGLGRIALSELYPRVRVTFDWQVEAFYSFVIEIPGEPWFRVSFDPRDVMELRGRDESWKAAFVRKVYHRRIAS